MKDTANKRKTTTLSCDKSTREFVAAEAERLGLTQRAVLARMVESYRHAQKRSATKTDEPKIVSIPGTVDINALKNDLSKVMKDNVSRMIAIVKEQEKLFLTPLVKDVETIKTQLENLE